MPASADLILILVKRRGVVFVYCDRNPKHKQRQG